MKLTGEQKKIVHTDPEKGGILLVSAYAGTGKTATLRSYAKKRPDSKILYLAFNKAIADEAKAKFKSLINVEAKTIHSLAFGYTGRHYKNRLGNIRAYDLQELNLVKKYDEAREVLDAFNYYLNSSYTSIKKTLKNYTLTIDKTRKWLTAKVRKLWEECLEKERGSTVPHDFYLKQFQLNPATLKYDYILVDEAQDITDAVIDLVSKQPSRKVFVGDSYQQLYSWKHAVNSLEKLREESTMLYLTKSFRCPQKVAGEADQYLRVLGADKAFYGAEKPKVTNKQTAYIARTNPTLFDLAANMDLEEKNVHFLGGISNYEFQTIVDARNLLDGNTKEIQSPFLRKFSSATELEDYLQEAKETDLETRWNIAKKYENAEEVYEYIYGNVEDRKDNADVILTTGHKVKGQQFRNVAIMEDFLDIKNQAAFTNNGPVYLNKEELNILYVSFTRSQKKVKIPPQYRLNEEDVSQIRSKIESGDIVLSNQ